MNLKDIKFKLLEALTLIEEIEKDSAYDTKISLERIGDITHNIAKDCKIYSIKLTDKANYENYLKEYNSQLSFEEYNKLIKSIPNIDYKANPKDGSLSISGKQEIDYEKAQIILRELYGDKKENNTMNIF